jgi:predicted PurR-regulated permease PerM
VRGHILFFFAVLLSLALAWRLRSVLELVYVSALFAVVLTPVVENIMALRLFGWSPPRPVAIITLVVFVLLALTAFLYVALPPVLHDIQHFASDLPSRVPEAQAKVERFPMADQLGLNSLTDRLQSFAAHAAQYVFASVPLWIRRFLDLIATFVLCIYFMLEGEFAYHYALSMFPAGSRQRLAGALVRAEHRMSKWLLGQGALMLILGATSTTVFALLHVHYFILLAASVAAMDSWTKMAGVFIFYAIYVQLETAVLTPRIMRTRVNLMGLSVLIALLAGSALAGIVGALVAVPSAALVAVLIDEYLVQDDPGAVREQQKAERKAS